MTAEMLCDCTHRKWGHAGGTYACWDCGCKRYTPNIQQAARDHAEGAPEVRVRADTTLDQQRHIHCREGES